jgi:O-antigen/teichoic acid export membrane protein
LRTTPQSSSAAPQSQPAPDHALEKRVGRGAVLLTATKLWFLASGYAIEAILPRIFERMTSEVEGKKLYGAYSVVTGLAAILNAFVYQGVSQAVARFVGRAPEELQAVRRAAFKLQGFLVGGLFAALFLLAPVLAREAYHGKVSAAALRYASFILLSYGFYAITMGSFTGRQLFRRQAGIDFVYSTAKVLCIAAGAWVLGKLVGWVEGAVLGFAAAAAIALGLSILRAPREPLRGHLAVSELFKFQLFTMVLNLVVTLVAKMDQQLLFGMTGDDALAGEYRAAQAFATIPYQAVFAITFVLFPLVSGAAAKDPERLRRTIPETARYALIIASSIALCFAAAPERAIMLLYKASYAPAAGPLRVLVLGYLAFSLFYVMSAVLTAAGRPHVSLGLVVVIAAIQSGLGALFVPRYGAVGIASATAVAMVTGLCGVQIALRRSFGAGIGAGRALRVLGAAACAAAVVHLLLDSRTFLGRPGFLAGVGGSASVQRIVTVIVFSAAGALFIALLFVTGGLGREDADRFKRVFARTRPNAERT